ncbi:hypothetical protein BC940DRAFT_309491 [Gongronella butleri]|nr:hypothetical protein BC940DRAFT_309491 [Gongronella butleri]
MKAALIATIAMAAVASAGVPGLHQNVDPQEGAIEIDAKELSGAHTNGGQQLNARQCASVWYLTKCNFYCPCGWYYYNDCRVKKCYDNDRTGCYGKCPSGASTQCGTCD